MALNLNQDSKNNGILEILLIIFRRLVALFLIGFAILYWTKILGLSGNPDLRIDTMSEPWQIASAVLAVIMPVAAIGLWGLFPWGTSSWLLIIAIELSMYWWRSDIFGSPAYIVQFHLICLATYFALKLAMMVQKRNKTNKNNAIAS